MVTQDVPQFGGSFAPRLDAAGVDGYRALARSAGGDVGGAMLKLCDLVGAYLGLHGADAPDHSGDPHPSGLGFVRRLPEETVERLDPHVPWRREVKELSALFDTIDPAADKPLRDAAHHLLWYAAELTMDRHPITTDTL